MQGFLQRFPVFSALGQELTTQLHNLAGALALVTVLAFWGIQALENAVLVPKLMGRVVNLYPLAVILALLVGGTLFGVIGTLIAIPVTAALAVLLAEVQRLMGASRMHNDTEAAERAAPPSTNLDETKAGDGE